MVSYWRPDECLHDMIFLYYVRTQAARQPSIYKLRLVIPAPRRFPDVCKDPSVSDSALPNLTLSIAGCIQGLTIIQYKHVTSIISQ